LNENIITNDYQSQSFFYELLGYLSNEIKNYPYNLVITSIDTENIYDDLKMVESEQASDAIILLGTNFSSKEILLIKSIQPNIVVIDICISTLDCNFVTMDNYQGGYEAAKHLLELNHRKIGYTMAIPRIYNFDERKRGFFVLLEEHNIEVAFEHIVKLPAIDIQEYIEIFAPLKEGNSLPTAFFCENDYIAISLIKTFAKLNIRIPEDVSIIGFDDISEAKVISPELTTIRVYKYCIAREALRVINLILNNKKGSTSHTVINTSLVERASCGEI